jgi:hypothetical protein
VTRRELQKSPAGNGEAKSTEQLAAWILQDARHTRQTRRP